MDETQLLDGLPIGVIVRSRGRTISAGECALLTDLTWTIGPIHSDHEYSKQTMFGAVVLPAPVMIALVGGLWTQSEHSDLIRQAGFRVVSALGVQARYRHPFHFGDTVHIESQVSSGRASATRPDQGVIVISDRALNQHGDVIIELERTQLVARIESAEARHASGG